MPCSDAFTQREANTRQRCIAPTALTLPDQSAHGDLVPVLAKGLAEPILLLLQLKEVLEVVCTSDIKE